MLMRASRPGRSRLRLSIRLAVVERFSSVRAAWYDHRGEARAGFGVAWLWRRPLPPIGEVVGQIEG
jgi:hypothetical protein